MLPPYPVHRWSVAEYLRLAQLGFLGEDDQIELLEGWPVKKMTKNPFKTVNHRVWEGAQA